MSFSFELSIFFEWGGEKKRHFFWFGFSYLRDAEDAEDRIIEWEWDGQKWDF